MNTHLPLPDGVTTADLDQLDIEALARVSPERAAIMADCAVKYKTYKGRTAWGETAFLVYHVREYALWQHHPMGFTSLNEWLMQPEIDIAPSVCSDMCFFIEAALEFQYADPPINLFQVLQDIGIGKMRAVIPRMRDAQKDDQLIEQFEELIPQLGAVTHNEMLEMIYPPGTRVNFEPIGVYQEHDDDTFTLSLRRLSFNQLEMAARKLGVKRWIDEQGRQIASPIVDLPRGH